MDACIPLDDPQYPPHEPVPWKRREVIGLAEIISGDCIAAMRDMAQAGVRAHAIVTDPPYHLTAGKKGGTGDASVNLQSPYGRARISTGFMSKQWDGGDIAFRAETWRLAWELLPPGGHLVAFGGTRTFHRMAVAIEDAGFEIRDTLMWLYGTGFPKSHDVSKGIDKMLGAEREVVGFHERDNLRRGKAGFRNLDGDNEDRGRIALTAAGSAEAAEWEGWGTALKPAWEPIILARKPLAGTVAANVLAHGTGALNIDGCRIGTEGGIAKGSKPVGAGRGIYGAGLHGACDIAGIGKGRWPANVLHDGSDEVEAAFAAFGDRKSGAPTAAQQERGGFAGTVHAFGKAARGGSGEYAANAGPASRFFYSAKASGADRAGSKHPTVKPVALMRWLVRMVCPPGGTVLDPFAGSGTTGAAAIAEGVGAILIEREDEYLADIRVRLSAAEKVQGDMFRDAQA